MNSHIHTMKFLINTLLGNPFLERYETSATFEIIGAHLRFDDISGDQLIDMGVDFDDVDAILEYAVDHKENEVVGVYKIYHYISMFDQLKDIIGRIDSGFQFFLDGTRRLIITFPASHCFQSIQFLVRKKETWEVNVIVNMRSCNFKVNFLTDLALSYTCGQLLSQSINRSCGFTIDKINVIMNIGSLHVYKNEV